MHTLSTDHRVLHVYLPWLTALLAATLELEGIHRLRRILFGVHPVRVGVRWMLLIVLGMVGAIGLSYALIYLDHAMHTRAVGYWLSWVVYLTYMTVLGELERQAGQAPLPDTDQESV
jgi:hypothetical protein